MSSAFSESAIVRAVAEAATRRITRKVIARLQHMTDTLSGDDSELVTIWDEICGQVQGEQSIFWDAYDDTVREITGALIDDLPRYEREAIWLQTDSGSNWTYDEPVEREADPVLIDDIMDYITNLVYDDAANWSNRRIRTYLERLWLRD